MKTETNAVSETLCCLVFRIPTMGKVQEASKSERYTPLSEPPRTCWYQHVRKSGHWFFFKQCDS
jgi:hypothetical protein